ncbi:substrate-binding domain-containing protein [Vogesella sp. DC21W]|uniref:Substrate-binding domain-containing protein n=1 Tax=Vogesella aquatica TaxID=2984206 RepID=A0ABT5IXH9_9NEIS|nr:substrate-binding domain-containing protein [Vogesella aquatica]MDC7717167.1 substrate-binding domain-containing protein [Vogesella aquatica]
MSRRMLCLLAVWLCWAPFLQAAQPNVVFIPKGASHVFWKEMARGAQDAALGLSINVVWRGPALENDAVSQGKLLEHYASKGFAGMIVAPNASAALQAPLRQVLHAGCRVVIVDSPLQPGLGLPYVGTHNAAAGALAAEYAAHLQPAPRKVLLLRFSARHDSTRERENAFRDRLQQLLPASRIEEREEVGITVFDTRDKVLKVLAAHPDADLVFTPNESTTEGTIQALQDAGLAGKLRHVGFDYSPRIDRALSGGQLQAVVMQDPYQMGVRAMTVIAQLLKKKPVPAVSYTPATLVTTADLAQPAVQAQVRPYLDYLQR